jgi:hypothetical protein
MYVYRVNMVQMEMFQLNLSLLLQIYAAVQV